MIDCGNCGKRHRTRTQEQCIDRNMNEATLQTRVIGRAQRKGFKVAHAGKGWVGDREIGEGQFVTPMSPGWPDLTLAKVGHHMIFMELKREDGVVSPEQVEWLDLLNRTGNFAIVVRPSDLREGRVNAILRDGAPI